MGNLKYKSANFGRKPRVTSKVQAHGNDPYFVKKANESKLHLEQYGFPTSFAKGSAPE